jgi:hypothetical protein
MEDGQITWIRVICPSSAAASDAREYGAQSDGVEIINSN